MRSTPTQARIAIVGAGWWATTAQIPAVQEHPAALLAALCDRDEAKLAVAVLQSGELGACNM